MSASIILVNLVGVAGLLLAAYVFLRPGNVAPLALGGDLRRRLARIIRRRRITASLMALIAVLFLIGINFLHRLPVYATTLLWLVVLLLLMAVLILAYLDLRNLRRIRDELQEQIDQQIHAAFGRPPRQEHEDN